MKENESDREDVEERREDEEATGAVNEHFNLVSVLYHSLKGASVCEEYIEDAREVGDDELAEFFERAQEEQRQRADEACSLLMDRLMPEEQAKAA